MFLGVFMEFLEDLMGFFLSGFGIVDLFMVT